MTTLESSFRLAAGPTGSSVNELWAELSATMRVLRQRSGLSLRDVEAATHRGRGVLSQIENGKARANRDLVEWYDETLGGDGLLISIYAEARTAYGPRASSRSLPGQLVEGDAMTVSDPTLPLGLAVAAGARNLAAGWTVTNAGTAKWIDRWVRRVGVHSAPRMISSAAGVALPDCVPGEQLDVQVTFDVPDQAGTFVAYWQVVDSGGLPCFDPAPLLSVMVVAMP